MRRAGQAAVSAIVATIVFDRISFLSVGGFARGPSIIDYVAQTLSGVLDGS